MTQVDEYQHHLAIFRERAIKSITAVAVEFSKIKTDPNRQQVALGSFTSLLSSLSGIRPWIPSSDFNNEKIYGKILECLGDNTADGRSLAGDLTYLLIDAVKTSFTSADLVYGINSLKAAQKITIGVTGSDKHTFTPEQSNQEDVINAELLKFAVSNLFSLSIEEFNVAITRAFDIIKVMIKDDVKEIS